MTPSPERTAQPHVLVYTWMDPENPRSGGDVRYISELCSRLSRDGARVSWIASRFPGAPSASTYHGFEIYRLGNLYSVFFAHLVSRRVRGLRSADFVLETVSSIPFFVRTRPSDRRAIVIQHVVPFSQMWSKVGPMAIVVYLIDRFITPAFYRDYLVLVPSQATEREVRAMGYRNVRRIMLGADPISWSENRKEPFVVAPGPVKPWKHHDHIIRAFSRVPGEWRLVIFGSYETPALEHSLRQLVRECGLEGRVDLLGHVDEETRINLLRRSSICAVASEKEGWGLVAMEAQAAGSPVVGYDVVGLNEAVQSGRTGLLVPFGDWRALGEAMSQLAQDLKLREQLGTEGAQRARERDWESCYLDFRRQFPMEIGVGGAFGLIE